MTEHDNQGPGNDLATSSNRKLAIDSETTPIVTQDVYYVPYDKDTQTGNYYEWADGEPLEGIVIEGLGRIGAIGD